MALKHCLAVHLRPREELSSLSDRFSDKLVKFQSRFKSGQKLEWECFDFVLSDLRGRYLSAIIYHEELTRWIMHLTRNRGEMKLIV